MLSMDNDRAWAIDDPNGGGDIFSAAKKAFFQAKELGSSLAWKKNRAINKIDFSNLSKFLILF